MVKVTNQEDNLRSGVLSGLQGLGGERTGDGGTGVGQTQYSLWEVNSYGEYQRGNIEKQDRKI